MGRNIVIIIKWAARALGVAVLGFGLAFYIGYGLVLPFSNPAYSLLDNVWLIVIPLMFVGLALGLMFFKTGGYLVTVPVVIGLLLGLVIEGEFVVVMLAPLFVGILYLILGYNRHTKKQA